MVLKEFVIASKVIGMVSGKFNFCEGYMLRVPLRFGQKKFPPRRRYILNSLCIWSTQMITTQYFLLPSRHPIGCLDSLCNSVARFVSPIYVSLCVPEDHEIIIIDLLLVSGDCIECMFFVCSGSLWYVFPNSLKCSFPFCSQWFNVDLVLGFNLLLKLFRFFFFEYYCNIVGNTLQ